MLLGSDYAVTSSVASLLVLIIITLIFNNQPWNYFKKKLVRVCYMHPQQLKYPGQTAPIFGGYSREIQENMILVDSGAQCLSTPHEQHFLNGVSLSDFEIRGCGGHVVECDGEGPATIFFSDPETMTVWYLKMGGLLSKQADTTLISTGSISEIGVSLITGKVCKLSSKYRKVDLVQDEAGRPFLPSVWHHEAVDLVRKGYRIRNFANGDHARPVKFCCNQSQEVGIFDSALQGPDLDDLDGSCPVVLTPEERSNAFLQAIKDGRMDFAEKLMTKREEKVSLWHARMGHPTVSMFRKWIRSTTGHGLVPEDADLIPPDFITSLAYSRRARRKKKSSDALLQWRLECRNIEPMTEWSFDYQDFTELGKGACPAGNCRFAINFICRSTHMKFSTYVPSTSTEYLVASLEKLRVYCNQHDRKLKKLWSDNQSSTVGRVRAVTLLSGWKQPMVAGWLNHPDHNVKLGTCPPYQHWRNSSAENMNLETESLTVALLLQSGQKISDWMYAHQHAVYLLNRRPHSALVGENGRMLSPLEAVTGEPVDISILKVYGAPALDHDEKRKKGQARRTLGMYVGQSAASHFDRGHVDTPHGHLIRKTNSTPIRGDGDVEFDETFKMLTEGRGKLFSGDQEFRLFDTVTAEEAEDNPDDPDDDEAQWSHPGPSDPVVAADVHPEVNSENSDDDSDANIEEGAEPLGYAMSRLGISVMKKPLPAVRLNPYYSRTDRIIFLQDNKKTGASRERYEQYKGATTLQGAKDLGASGSDLGWDFAHGYWRFVDSHLQTQMAKDREASNMAFSLFYPQFGKDDFGSDAGTPSCTSPIKVARIDASKITNYSDIVFVDDGSVKVTADLSELKDCDNQIEMQALVDNTYKEIKTLTDLGSWEHDWLPPGRKPISTRLVIKYKYHSDGKFDKLKIRLVARGFLQIEGRDYYHTFAPAAKLASLRVLMAMGISNNWDFHTSDCTAAFCQAGIDVPDLYINLPKGVEVVDQTPDVSVHSKRDRVRALKLKKALYGLVQSPALWHGELAAIIEQQGYKRSRFDPCLFYKKHSQRGYSYVLAYVDDILYTGDDKQSSLDLYTVLASKFTMNKYEPLRGFLGLLFEKTGDYEWTMDRKAQLRKDLEKHNAFEQKDHSAPMVATSGAGNVKLFRSHCESCGQWAPPIQSDLLEAESTYSLNTFERYCIDNYASIVGELSYYARTCRPDVSFALSKLSTRQKEPDKSAGVWCAQTLRYLKSEHSIDMQFKLACPPSRRNNGYTLDGFTDSNYGDRTSPKFAATSGYIWYLNGMPISWRAKKQTVPSDSAHEAECMAAHFAINEGMWLRGLLGELGVDLPRSNLFIDNKGAVFTIGNPCTEWRSATLATKYYKCRYAIDSGDIHCEYVSGDINVSDLLTKPLTGAKFELFSKDIMGQTASIVVALSEEANFNHAELTTVDPQTTEEFVDNLSLLEKVWLGGAWMFG